jgi:hypothetical protein
MSRLYFAYGSNMDPRQMRLRCPNAERIQTATLPGYRFLINRRGVATIERHAKSSVMGVVWKLTRECERSLDLHEGVLWGFYRKETVAVLGHADRRAIPALVYIDPIRERGLARSGYIEKVLLGARRANIPEDNFRRYLNWCRRHAA